MKFFSIPILLTCLFILGNIIKDFVSWIIRGKIDIILSEGLGNIVIVLGLICIILFCFLLLIN